MDSAALFRYCKTNAFLIDKAGVLDGISAGV
jgi:hypothetical protein